MAVTHGHGNPNWTRDETILALDAYFTNRGRNLSARDPVIVELSETLRRLPYHQEAARQPTFRNPDGAAFKVQNLKSQETGKGLQNVSRMDREIWNEFKGSPAEVARLADLIRSGIAAEPAQDADAPEEDIEFYEGRLLTRAHLRRERDRRLRAELLRRRREKDAVACDLCGHRHLEVAPDFRDAAFEAHHVVPIAVAGQRPTRLTDVALLCATCHRLIHKLIAKNRTWLAISDAKLLIRPAVSEPAAG